MAAWPRIARPPRRTRDEDLARYRPWRPDDPTLDPPAQADWAWRPGLWRDALDRAEQAAGGPRTVLCAGAALHHDAGAGRLRLLQAPGDGSAAAFSVTLSPEALDARFVSLALDLPRDACAGFSGGQMLIATVRIAAKDEMPLWMRLNMVRAANAESRTVRFDPAGPAACATVDLFDLPDRVMPPDRMWIDLILDAPAGPIRIDDLQLARVPRPSF